MSKEVQERIKEALRNKAKSLDLSYCDLSELPKELGALTLLVVLILHGNKELSDLIPRDCSKKCVKRFLLTSASKSELPTEGGNLLFDAEEPPLGGFLVNRRSI